MNLVSKKYIAICVTLIMLAGLFTSFTTFAAVSVEGDDVILRSPNGHTALFEYSLSGVSNLNPVWSLDGAPEGVEIKDDGGLLVPGNSQGGSFSIIASDTAGNTLATKTISIMDKLYSWADNYERAFVDFEEQVPSDAPSDRLIGTSNWNDHIIRFKRANRTNNPLAVVKQEANGNKYISAIGTSSWYNNGAGFVTDLISMSDDAKAAFTNADVVTLEADFMAESSMISSYNSGNTFWSLLTVIPSGSSSVALDFRYKPSGSDSIEIHSFTDSNGAGNQSSSQGKIATLSVDEWFNVRIEASLLNGTYDLYINNEKLFSGKHTMPNVACSNYIGIGVDNFAAYTGCMQVPHISANYPDTLYFTPTRQEAVVELDTSVYLGKYPYENKVSYTGNGVTFSGSKLFVPAASGDVAVFASDSKYNLSKDISFTHSEGVELSFDGTKTGMDSGTASLSDGCLDTSVGSATFDLKDAKGNMLLTFDSFDAVNIKLDTTESTNPIFVTTDSPVGSSAELVLVADTMVGTYKVIFDNKLISDGTLPAGALHSLTVNGALIDNLVYSSMNATGPYAFSPVISGVSAVGQELEADYTYYSPWKAKESTANITWLVSETLNGTYTYAGTGKYYTPKETDADKYLKFELTVSDDKSSSANVTSESVYINDTYTLTLSENNLRFKALNSLGGSNAYAVISLYQDDILKETELIKIEFTGSEFVWNKNITGFDGAMAVMFYENNLKAVSTPKTIGTVPTNLSSANQTEDGVYVKNNTLYISGAADTMTSVLIYNHMESASDASICYSSPYTREQVLEKCGTSDANKVIRYATSVVLNSQGKQALNLPELSDGSYTADVIFKDGTNKTCTFMVSPQNILNVQKMDMPGFLDVLKLYSANSDGLVETNYEYYKTLSDNGKSKVAKLLSDSEYDISKFDAATLLCSYLESESFDETLYAKLKTELTALNFDTSAIDIIKNDANPAATGAEILNSTWTGFDEFLNVTYEKSILYGIYHVKNYMEADCFLSLLTDTNYASSNDKSGICNLVAGKLYNSLPNLKQSVNLYKKPAPNVGGGGGSSSVSGGTTTITMPVPSVPQRLQLYSDVTSDHWADESISYLSNQGIINGLPDGSFAPEANITRAEFVKIICEAFDISGSKEISFSDVSETSWYAKYVNDAASAGIVNGADGKFSPDSFITRQDASVILYRVLSSVDYSFDNDGIGFADKSDIFDYALDAVVRLQGMGLINGMEDGCFYPQNLMTRAQCAHIIANALRSF